MITVILASFYGIVLAVLSVNSWDTYEEEYKPFYRPNSSAGMRRLRILLWPIAMFMP